MPGFDVETPNGDSSNGPRFSRDSSRNTRDLPSLSSPCFPITLKFMDVCYQVKIENKQKKRNFDFNRMFCDGPTQTVDQERTILNGITGMVSPGQILAVLGPSGSGKSTFLNALSGRLHHGHGFTGTILANGAKLSKTVLRRTGFVTQDDVLYPHLTVRETLVFCSLLRLPNSLTKEEKASMAESVISELGLVKCQNTIVGNSFIRGISGGERKRVSIANEMLINPSLLILDEPTSGLDSTGAHRLVTTLGSLAQKGKTIVTSMHQPSSQVYQMFHSVLLLSEGRCLYFGKGSEALGYFDSVGFSPSFAMNPADFLLDLANGVCQHDNISGRDKPNIKQTLFSSYNTLLAPKVKAACMDTTTIPSKETIFIGDHSTKEHRCNNRLSLSTWFNQFSILLQRSLIERKHESFNTLRIFQVIAAAILSGLMWWHSDYKDIQDRLGLLFFIAIFWGVFPSFNAVFAFPQERAIFMKERASELGAFLLTLLVLLGYVLVSQGLGLFLGAAIMDAKQASTLALYQRPIWRWKENFIIVGLLKLEAWTQYS
nr:abc transporter g family member 25 [Quercus suber]